MRVREPLCGGQQHPVLRGAAFRPTEDQIRPNAGASIVPAEFIACTRLRRDDALEDPASGRVLEIWSDQPGMRIYTGNFLDGMLIPDVELVE